MIRIPRHLGQVDLPVGVGEDDGSDALLLGFGLPAGRSLRPALVESACARRRRTRRVGCQRVCQVVAGAGGLGAEPVHDGAGGKRLPDLGGDLIGLLGEPARPVMVNLTIDGKRDESRSADRGRSRRLMLVSIIRMMEADPIVAIGSPGQSLRIELLGPFNVASLDADTRGWRRGVIGFDQPVKAGW